MNTKRIRFYSSFCSLHSSLFIMSNNTENIEARLCAFVEGDLDEAARAEIEKHLETHPAHRALLDELKRTTSMMMSLPHEQAPADLSETLQGHLERSVLLDGVGAGHANVTLKINRWPQLMGVAAVVVLAVGLGALVYVVLPSHSSTPVALNKTLPHSAELPSNEKMLADALRDEKELGKIAPAPGERTARKVAEDKSAVPAAPGAPTEPVVTRSPAEALTLKDAAGATDGMRSEKFKKGGSKTGFITAGEPANITHRRVYVVVSTDNLQTTNSQLAHFLTAQNITWEPADRGILLASGDLDSAAALHGVGGYQLNGSGSNHSANGVATQSLQPNNTTPDSSNQYSQMGNKNFEAKNSSADSHAATANQQVVGADQTQNGIAQATGAASQSATPSVPGASPAMQQAAMVSPPFDLANSSTANVIVCRDLTRQQTADLSESIDKLYAGQSVRLIDQDTADRVQQSLDARQVAGKSELAQQNEELQKKMAALERKISGVPSTAPTTQADVDGQAPAVTSVAGTGRAEVPSLTPSPAEAPAANGPPLSITPQPATQPSAFISVVTQPPAAGVAQADQPMAPQAAPNLTLKPQPATQPVETKMDVVIVVQATNGDASAGAVAKPAGDNTAANPANATAPAVNPANPTAPALNQASPTTPAANETGESPANADGSAFPATQPTVPPTGGEPVAPSKPDVLPATQPAPTGDAGDMAK
jgi:hypothetical protein